VLVMSLATHHMVAPHVAFALVLGANLGTAINPMIEGVTGDDPAARRLPLGNLLTRVIGVLAGLMLLPYLQPMMSGARTEDEGLFVCQHEYWARTMRKAIADGKSGAGR